MAGRHEVGKEKQGQALKAKGADEKGEDLAEEKRPRCLAVAAKGIRTSSDFAKMMSSMMADLVEGNITPQVGNAVTNSAGKLLKVVEMEMKYGTTQKGGEGKSLQLVSE